MTGNAHKARGRADPGDDMAFSIKQLLFCTAVVAFGLLAMLSQYKPVLAKLFDLLTLGIVIGMAYRAWLANGESRAFRVGFLCWASLYFFLFKKTFDVGISDLMGLAYRAVQPSIVSPQIRMPYSNFNPVFHSLFLLLFGVLGGWVTVYFYRKRQRMLNQPS